MPTPRTFPDRTLSVSERSGRARERRREYVAALEALALDAAEVFRTFDLRLMQQTHAATIERARRGKDGG